MRAKTSRTLRKQDFVHRYLQHKIAAYTFSV